MEKALNSAMIEERNAEIVARKNEIVDEVNAKKAEFESADVEKREALLAEVEKLTNESEQLDKEMESLEEQRSTLKAQEERMSLSKNLEKTIIDERKEKTMENVEMRNTPEYAHAWVESVKGRPEQLRTLMTTNAENGSVPIPMYMQGRIEASWERLSILNEVSKTYFKGITAVGVETASTGAEIHEEGDAAPDEETLTLVQVVLTPVTIKKWIRVTSEVEALSDEAFMDYLVDELIYQVNKGAEDFVVRAAGRSDLSLHLTGQTLGFNTFNAALAELDIDEAVVIMNRATFFNNVMGLVDGQQRPIFQIATNNEGKPKYFINGLRVLFSNMMKAYDAANLTDIYAMVCDPKAIRVNLPAGQVPSIIYDPYTEAQADLSKYVAKLMIAAEVVRPRSVVTLVKGTNN